MDSNSLCIFWNFTGQILPIQGRHREVIVWCSLSIKKKCWMLPVVVTYAAYISVHLVHHKTVYFFWAHSHIFCFFPFFSPPSIFLKLSFLTNGICNIVSSFRSSSWKASLEQQWWRWETVTPWTGQSLTWTTTFFLDRNSMFGKTSCSKLSSKN